MQAKYIDSQAGLAVGMAPIKFFDPPSRWCVPYSMVVILALNIARGVYII